MSTERELRIALLMCAASCQGGDSDAGMAAAKVLGIEFPIRMEGLAKVAEREGLNRDELWPWWKELREARSRINSPQDAP
jgi:transposase-like protein